jgi:hypothetical protein
MVLSTEVPAGRWAILRLGYSLTGQTNDPATQQGVGLEVDKLDRAAVTSHFETYLGKMADAKGLSHLMLDSWEANQQNWTANMLGEFRQRRGYDPLPWLAVLSGRVVDSAEASDRFLWDFRRTIADLISDNHYGAATDVAHKHGMQLYAEAMGVNLPTVGDGLQAKGRADIPMGEFWDRNPGEKPIANQVSDIREAASAAHIYGKTLVAAEAFTATPMIPSFSRSPRDLKWIADQYMALGVNRFVIHASPHQPFEDRKPGVSLWRFGQHFTRNETWAEQARPWMDYLSRASYMLQQGRAVNDIAYFYGEGAPVAAPFAEPDRPACRRVSATTTSMPKSCNSAPACEMGALNWRAVRRIACWCCHLPPPLSACRRCASCASWWMRARYCLAQAACDAGHGRSGRVGADRGSHVG